MTTLAPITDALETAEDVILAVLRGIASGPQETPAFWNVADPGTVGRALLAETHADHLPWFLVAQHQDGGGAQRNYIGGRGWGGKIVVRAMSHTDANARVGRAAADVAMQGALTVAGYSVYAIFEQSIPFPPLDLIYTRANQWDVTIRRTA